MDPLIGSVIAGKFAVSERLGAGAMGIVYRATQIALERTVAIKVLNRELWSDPHFAERFAREAKAASRLDHPNSIRVIDFGQEPDGLLYLAMEYVDGSDLFDWLTEHAPLEPRIVVELLVQVLSALAMAHDVGVVHRDLKPENIMIVRGVADDGRPINVVKVCDFGIAKLLDAAPPSNRPAQDARRKHSTTGLVVGTPAYMSPEQARGEQQDARSDLYALGIVMYELLTGRVPFEAETLMGIALKHVNEPPERPSARAPGVNPLLEAICLKAISKKPVERYQTAREMRLAMLDAASSFASGGASSPLAAAGAFSPPSPVRRRHDSGKPTLVGVTPDTPAARFHRSRAWLGLLLLPPLGGALLIHGGPHWLSERGRIAQAPSALSSSSAAAVSSAQTEPEVAGARPAPEPAPASLAERGAKPARAKPGTLARGIAPPEAQPSAAPEAPAPAPTPRAEVEPLVAVAAAVLAPSSTSQSAKLAPSAPRTQEVSPEARSDPALARVTLGLARHAVGATAASVTRAVSEATARITACYQAALPRLGSATEGTGVLHVDTDGAGIITDAQLSGPIRGSVPGCVAAAVLGHRIANVDTGNASADVPLTFKDH